MIRYIYTFKYESEDDSWEFHLAVTQLAVKFGIPALEQKAIHKLYEVADAMSHARDAQIFIRHFWHRHSDYSRKKLQHIVHTLGRNHGEELTKIPQYALLSDDPEVMRDCIQRTGFAHDLIVKYFYECPRCKRGRMMPTKVKVKCCNTWSKGNRCWIDKFEY